jgi:hypothetical protein
MSMRMRRSLDELEEAFVEQAALERDRQESLRRSTVQRSFVREAERRHKHGTFRFVLLVLTLMATAAFVTVVMFRVLYLLLA